MIMYVCISMDTKLLKMLNFDNLSRDNRNQQCAPFKWLPKIPKTLMIVIVNMFWSVVASIQKYITNIYIYIIPMNSVVPLRFLKLHDYPGVFGKRLGWNCLSLGSLARSNASRGQAEIDDLPELVDLVAKISNGNISFFQSFFEHLDHLVATSKRHRPLVQQSF